MLSLSIYYLRVPEINYTFDFYLRKRKPMNKMKRLDGESIEEWLNRVSIKDSVWLRDAKRRRKYKILYNIKFYIQLKYGIVKRFFKWI